MFKDWERSELRAAQEFSEYEAYEVPLSGRGISDKLDVGFNLGKLIGYLLSNKFTKQESVSISKKDWLKDKKQAMMNGKKFFRRTEFSTGEKIIHIDQDWFKELIQDEDICSN